MYKKVAIYDSGLDALGRALAAARKRRVPITAAPVALAGERTLYNALQESKAKDLEGVLPPLCVQGPRSGHSQ